MTCEEVRLSLGAHALGALEPEEAAEVDDHLATCDACLEEFTGLASLPPVLAKVTEKDIELVASPPPQVLDRLLATKARRNRRGRWLMAVAASAAVLVVGGTVWNAAQRSGELASTNAGGAPAAQSQESYDAPSVAVAPEEPAAESKRSATQADTFAAAASVSASVIATPAGTGSRLRLTVAGAPPGVECRVVVLGRDGTEDATAPWRLEQGYSEPSATFTLRTRIPPAAITGFRLVDAAGTVLTVVPAK
ncbi:zf-HC2 domain-containing protein [Nonomuraea sp. NPDC050310]|uniref:anti-sigma factor family protein n=1 Tax=Nonomuraea sp. NPDC050310 TaxID=3154935 RepID=UPI00340517A9